jgi:hypothetical protein
LRDGDKGANAKVRHNGYLVFPSENRMSRQLKPDNPAIWVESTLQSSNHPPLIFFQNFVSLMP